MSLIDVLAKDCLDIGVFTNNLEPMLAFWQHEVGFAFDHMLPVGGGVRQHRHDHQDSVFKLNHSRDELAAVDSKTDSAVSSCYLRIVVARPDVAAPRELKDPDGNRVLLVPVGWSGVSQWAVEVATGSVEEFAAFYASGLGLVSVADSELEPDYACAVRCGRSLILGCVNEVLREEPLSVSQATSAQMRRIGITYTTIQVQKVDSVYAQVLGNGGLAGREPATLGETARIAFVRDQRGSWVELSQRASLTGSLAIG